MGHGHGGGIVAHDPAQVSGYDGVFSAELVENAAVLRGVSRAGKTLTTGESFVLDAQLDHFEQVKGKEEREFYL